MALIIEWIWLKYSKSCHYDDLLWKKKITSTVKTNCSIEATGLGNGKVNNLDLDNQWHKFIDGKLSHGEPDHDN